MLFSYGALGLVFLPGFRGGLGGFLGQKSGEGEDGVAGTAGGFGFVTLGDLGEGGQGGVGEFGGQELEADDGEAQGGLELGGDVVGLGELLELGFGGLEVVDKLIQIREGVGELGEELGGGCGGHDFIPHCVWPLTRRLDARIC